ncbi:Imm1 family immunity protein [Amycolatopsis roodepoortensis]|uniref:Imm1 family immunity protein n=1 Tax=Amycolatopsis roodepoortensis TaxID=700274 RepID=UPI003530D7EE
MTTPGLARQDAYDVAAMATADDLVSMLKAVNAERERPDAGVVWWLHVADQPDGELIVGVRGAHGVALWSEPSRSFRPEDGANVDHVDYFTWLGHHYTQPPRTEVPVEHVYQAVAEFVRTKARPNCIRWVEVPSPTAPTA